MKKFSKLILESKEEVVKKHPLINPVYWDEVFKPLIDHIDGDLISKVPPPGDGVYSDNTKKALDRLMQSIKSDSIEYYKNVVHDGSQDSFFDAFEIDIRWEDLMDCLLPLTDRTSEVDDYPNWESGYLFMAITDIDYESVDDIIDDILDISDKLKIFNIDYKIYIYSEQLELIKKSIIKTTTDESIINHFKNTKNVLPISQIDIFIYNKDSLVGDLP